MKYSAIAIQSTSDKITDEGVISYSYRATLLIAANKPVNIQIYIWYMCKTIWKMSIYVVCPRKLQFTSLIVKTWNKPDICLVERKKILQVSGKQVAAVRC